MKVFIKISKVVVAEIRAEEDARMLDILDQLSFINLFVFDRCEWIISNGHRQEGDEAQTCVEAPMEWLESDGCRKSLCKMHSQRYRELYDGNITFKILTRTEAMMKNALE